MPTTPGDPEVTLSPLPYHYQCGSAWNVDPLSGRIGVRPRRWTRSGGGFDRGAGVAVLELDGAEIAQGRV